MLPLTSDLDFLPMAEANLALELTGLASVLLDSRSFELLEKLAVSILCGAALLISSRAALSSSSS